jgi:hypothetical protein
LGTNNGDFLFYLGAKEIASKKDLPIKGGDFRVSNEYRANASSNNRLVDDYALVRLDTRVK